MSNFPIKNYENATEQPIKHNERVGINIYQNTTI